MIFKKKLVLYQDNVLTRGRHEQYPGTHGYRVWPILIGYRPHFQRCRPLVLSLTALSLIRTNEIE